MVKCEVTVTFKYIPPGDHRAQMHLRERAMLNLHVNAPAEAFSVVDHILLSSNRLSNRVPITLKRQRRCWEF